MKGKKAIALLMASSMIMGMSAGVYAADMSAAEAILADAKAAAEQVTAAAEEAVAEETAVTEEAAAETTTASTALSDDLYAFELEVGGEIYQFPMTYEDLLAKGWNLSKNEDPEMKLESNEYTSVTMIQGENSIYVDMVNFGINAMPVTECLVGGIDIDASYNYNLESLPVNLPKGIVMGQASVDDIKHVYGEPSDLYESEYSTALTYSKDYYEEWRLTVDAETGVLTRCEVQNLAEPEGFDKGTVNTETPEIVTAYQAPTALGEEMLSPVVEYFGDLYQLPAPLSAFTANGWSIVDAEEGAYVAGGDFDSVEISKENQNVTVYISNYTENAVLIENCFVEELSFATYDPEIIDMKLSGNVTIGTERADLIAAAEASGYLYEDEEDYLRIYADIEAQYDQYVEFGFYNDENPTAASSMGIYWEE